MLEKLNRINRLNEFYGGLLTERQRTCIDMYYRDDFSLTEIAENLDITKQAVSETIKRSEKKLRDFEDKLKLIKRMKVIEDKIVILKKEISNIDSISDEDKNEIMKLIDEIQDT